MTKQITQIKFLVLAIITLCASAAVGNAQTTQFTYQGKLNDISVASPTNGTYEMLFKLFTTAQTGTGTEIDSQLIPNVSVVNGIFTVQLDAENSFNSGADLYIEISVRPAGSQAALTTLAPRQQVTSAPYAIRSLNAGNALVANNSLNLGGLAANTYIQTGDSRLSDSRDPLAGSQNYIQNSTIQQPLSNFSISGGGNLGGTLSANLVNSVTNFRIGNVPVFGTPNQTSVVAGQSTNFTLLGADNAFFGYKAGELSNNTSQANTFIGSTAGRQNTSGDDNAFVGKSAGYVNQVGSFNSFFGSGAGYNNNVDGNSFFGYRAGYLSGTGLRNSIFGFQAGQTMQNVSDNSFFGYEAGKANLSGNRNAFFGGSSGIVNNTGNNNSFFGDNSGAANKSGFRNTFVGSNSGFQITTQQESTLIGFNTGGTGSQNTAVGAFAFGTQDFNTDIGYNSQSYGTSNTTLGENTTAGTNAVNVSHSTAIGADAVVTTNNTIVIGTNTDTVKIPKDMTVAVGLSANVVTVTGELRVPYLSVGVLGEFHLCINNVGNVYRCGSFGNNITQTSEPNLQKQNAPVEAQTEQTNAQQIQINLQAEKLKQQQETIDELKKLVCATNPTADICRQ